MNTGGRNMKKVHIKARKIVPVQNELLSVLMCLGKISKKTITSFRQNTHCTVKKLGKTRALWNNWELTDFEDARLLQVRLEAVITLSAFLGQAARTFLAATSLFETSPDTCPVDFRSFSRGHFLGCSALADNLLVDH